ncbi:MAG: MFS transporter [Gemmatimonadetes bacterium]|uniref:MFS transporter n=1 Tax=Candidatus Kutchimonas denitrificans TaxID=3056748 RepID=A0AAE5CBD3_9BACT|nr:MFS transporter [Gemmatimonadota bacterium]NIR74433.1 MFS transporter [Candidatus Kutchimonas denitrificans]NIS00829.1 MFS transporter [Gemmatimonadota bacterium]NIT66452.1 MFS transporter [Gemmatimonadota bacterium]NIU52083.1 MFS transporter [Gemmatimonadota bacterium]
MSRYAPLAPLTIAAYGAPGLVLAALALTFYVFLPKYYADIVGIDLTVLGLLVLLSRVWDAVIDPAIGAWSDRTVSRWGRRRVWMALGAVPLALSFLALVRLPTLESPWLQAVYLGALTFLFFFFWTMVTVPYEAMGAELSFDYDERTRLLGVREGAVLAGTLLAALIPLAVGYDLAPADVVAAERQRYWRIGLVYALLVVALIGVCVVIVRERAVRPGQRPEAFFRGLATLWGNRPFRILLSAYAVTALGFAVAATLVLFYVDHVLASDRGPLILALYLGVGTALVPVWIKMAALWEKRRAWLIALALNTGAFVWAIFLGPGDGTTFGIIVVVSALGVGGVMALPPSMQADVIDYDEWRTGLRREGEYIGFWSIVKKLAAALSAGLAFPILDLSGYAPGAEQQGSAAVWALKLLYVGVPSLCNVIAFAIVWRYPIDRTAHQALRAEIDARPLPINASTEPKPVTSWAWIDFRVS